MNEMTFKKEAYTEIAKFQKNLLSYLGENADIIDNETQTKEDNEFSTIANEHNNSIIDQPVNLYKTETEKLIEGEGLPQLKVLGKINLDTLPRKKNNLSLYSLKFNFICNKLNILNVIKNIKYYEDDSFYGTICKKHNIKYIDLHKKSFYLFHTKIKPLHETIKNMRDNLSYYNKIIL